MANFPQRPIKIFDGKSPMVSDPKKIYPSKPKYNLRAETAKKKKATGEAQLFADIWAKRPHVSQISGEPLGDEMCSWMFMHVLSKAQNKYPLFKLYAPNVVLATWDEHDMFDKAPRSEIENEPKWQPLLMLEAELKEEYKKLITPKK